MTDEERDYYEEILGRGAGDPDMKGYKPDHIPYVGDNKPQIEVRYEPRNRREYPIEDYLPSDEDLETWEPLEREC